MPLAARPRSPRRRRARSLSPAGPSTLAPRPRPRVAITRLAAAAGSTARLSCSPCPSLASAARFGPYRARVAHAPLRSRSFPQPRSSRLSAANSIAKRVVVERPSARSGVRALLDLVGAMPRWPSQAASSALVRSRRSSASAQLDALPGTRPLSRPVLGRLRSGIAEGSSVASSPGGRAPPRRGRGPPRSRGSESTFASSSPPSSVLLGQLLALCGCAPVRSRSSPWRNGRTSHQVVLEREVEQAPSCGFPFRSVMSTRPANGARPCFATLTRTVLPTASVPSFRVSIRACRGGCEQYNSIAPRPAAFPRARQSPRSSRGSVRAQADGLRPVEVARSLSHRLRTHPRLRPTCCSPIWPSSSTRGVSAATESTATTPTAPSAQH